MSDVVSVCTPDITVYASAWIKRVKLVDTLEEERELDTPTLERELDTATLERELLELETGTLELTPPTTP